MNRAFDYNGTIVAPSHPVRKLKTVKKVVSIDSADRDTTKFYTNGDFVVYLPRTYENVVSIRLMSAEFPPIYDSTSAGALTHSYAAGTNALGSTFSSDTKVTATTYYFFVDIEGINYSDETVVAANRSTYTDSFTAKIPAVLTGTAPANFIEYNDHSAAESITRFTPAIGKLDRMRIRTRTHDQQGNTGFMYWTTDGEVAASNRGINYTLLFEIEMLDNTFDDFSSFETRISERA
jgi:hypothetical protein